MDWSLDGLKQAASDGLDAVADEAKKVETAVVDEVKKVETAVVDEGKKVEQTVSDGVQAVEQKAHEVAQKIKKKAQGAEDWAKKKAKQAEQKAKDAVDEAKKDVDDEVKRGEDELKTDKDKILKLVSSLTSPTTRILPPSTTNGLESSGNSSLNSVLTEIMFGKDNKDEKVIIESFIAQIQPPPDSHDKPRVLAREEKIPKGSILLLSWSISPPKTLDFEVNQKDKSIVGTLYCEKRHLLLFHSRDAITSSGPEGSCTVTFDEDCSYVLVADILSDFKPKDRDVSWEEKIPLEISGKPEESGGGEVKFKNAGVAWHLPEPIKIPLPYFEAEFDVKVILGGEVTYKFKDEKPDEKKDEEIRDKLARSIVEKEKRFGHFSNVKLHEDESGWKRATEIGFEDGKFAGEIGMEGTLTVGDDGKDGLSFKLKFLLLKLNSESYKVEVLAAAGGAEFQVDLAGWEPIDTIEFAGVATLEVAVEATPDWKQIGKDVLEKLGVDIGIDVIFPAAVFLVGVMVIVGTAYILWTISDALSQGEKALSFAHGWIDGYLSQLSDGKLGREPEDSDGKNGFEKGKEAAMEKRHDLLEAGKKNADAKGKTSLDLEAELSAATVKQEAAIREQLTSRTIERVRRLYWQSYASANSDSLGGWNLTITGQDRLAAFGALFSNIKPVPPQAELNRLWQAFVNEKTADTFRKTPEYEH